MKPPRSARLLPRYMLRKPLKNGTWAYFFNVPTWARKAGCQIANEPLGGDYEAAAPKTSSCPRSMLGVWAVQRMPRQPAEPLVRSIGFSPSIAQTDASQSSTPRQGGTTRRDSDSWADTL